MTLDHREWVRGLFVRLLTEAGIASPESVALQLCLLYDGAMASAQADPSRPWASAARDLAHTAIAAADGDR
ncbi:hypothetical protein [Curtobacterium sp. BH-2-1-1]|uniref:hypothetical protein n=1 Tax=Curtobacterium sp. BH-2-1-1 TaxID=1905847 RepID=UPI00119DCB7A|nr:hypothetical protein [Curtobacterium sp. BH-2-1-1]